MAESLARPAWIREDLQDAQGRGVRVAVIDSGRDPAWGHPGILPGIGLVAPGETIEHCVSEDDRDRLGHGTACCDILLSVAPEVEILPLRVFGSAFETSPESLGVAIQLAAEHGCNLINLSLGTLREDVAMPLYAICEDAREQGILVIAAVQFGRGTSFPAAFENVLGVQAGRFANIFDFELRPGRAAEIIAHGDREVRWLGGQRRRIYGSSFAAPHVTGIVALLRERNPELDLETTRELLAQHARPSGTCFDQGPDHPQVVTPKELAEIRV